MSRGRSIVDRLFVALQAPLPHHLLSRLVGALAESRWPPLKALLIGLLRRAYAIDLGEAAESDPRAYPSFAAFFARALAPGARPLAAGDDAVVSPVDGTVSQAGTAGSGRLLQAKGHEFELADLLGSAERAAPFHGGPFVTLYLAPSDYHRIHSPLAGRLRETVAIPGRLWAVNTPTARALPRLFARNERLVTIFDTAAGRMAVVLVGALFVGGIETVWGGREPSARRWGGRGDLAVTDFAAPAAPAVALARGEELGRFNFGSTVIVLFEPGRVAWEPWVTPGARVRMGSLLGLLLPEAIDRHDLAAG